MVWCDRSWTSLIRRGAVEPLARPAIMSAAMSAPTNAPPAPGARAGVIFSVAAYTMWGLLPLYLKALKGVTPMEVLLHRMVWAAVFLGIILPIRGRFGAVVAALRDGKSVRASILSAAVLTINWFVFIWA